MFDWPQDGLILLRYHLDWDLTRNRIASLRALNPGVRIAGLYGGAESVPAHLTRAFDLHYCLTHPSPDWKWRFLDLCMLEWFGAQGRHIGFEHVVVVEWDLLLLGRLEQLLAEPQPDAIQLTALRPLQEIESTWYWTSQSPAKEEWARLKAHVRARHGFRGTFLACLGAAPVLSRRFLDAYSRMELPELGHDELRLPLAAQLTGLGVTDNDLVAAVDTDWFNVAGRPVSRATIKRGIDTGVRVFHPVHHLIDPPGRVPA